jgi:hypothetical protein
MITQGISNRESKRSGDIRPFSNHYVGNFERDLVSDISLADTPVAAAIENRGSCLR